MATVYSHQLAKQLFTRLTYSAPLAILMVATEFLSRMVYQSWTKIYGKLVSTDHFRKLSTTGRNQKAEVAVLASLLGQGGETMARRSISEMEGTRTGEEPFYQTLDQALSGHQQNVHKSPEPASRITRPSTTITDLERTKRSTPDTDTNNKTTEIFHQLHQQEILVQHLERALTRINKHRQHLCKLAEQLSRSPKAIKTIKDLEAAIAISFLGKPIPEYEISEYATGNKRWRRAPAQHQVPIQDLLQYDLQSHQDKNKILGEKVGQVVQQNLRMAQLTSSMYDTPSENL
jgi:hypothetical protein